MERVLPDVLAPWFGYIPPLMLMVLSESAQALMRMQTQRYGSAQTLMLALVSLAYQQTRPPMCWMQ